MTPSRLYMYVCNFLSPGSAPCRVWHFNIFRWTIDIIASTGQHKNQTSFKILSRNRNIMVPDNITFMTPTQRYYAHISSTSFGQIFWNPFSSSRRRSREMMSEENLPVGTMAGKPAGMHADGRVNVMYVASDVVRGQGWMLGNASRCCRRFNLQLRVLYHHKKPI